MIEYDELLCVRYSIVNDPDLVCSHEQYGTRVSPLLKQIVSNRQLVISLDQATVKTGMCVMDFNTRQVLAVFDLINAGFPNKQLYFESLYDYVNELIANQSVRYFIYEIPVEHSNNSNTLALLEALRLFVKNFKHRIKSLQNAEMIEINSNTWKSNFLADPKYQGRRKKREDVKESARCEAIQRVPELELYFNSYTNPPDSCDAVGIAYGALEEIYSKSNPSIRRPNKTMPRKNIKFEYHIEALKVQDALSFAQKTFEYAFFNSGYEVLEFNSSLTVEDNCRRYCGASEKLGIIPVTNAKISQELKWETGQILHNKELYIIFCKHGGLR